MQDSQTDDGYIHAINLSSIFNSALAFFVTRLHINILNGLNSYSAENTETRNDKKNGRSRRRDARGRIIVSRNLIEETAFGSDI